MTDRATPAAASGAAVGDTGPPLYVYGVLAAGTALREPLPAGVGDKGEPRLLEANGLAAVVSEVPEGWATATRADVEAHERVLSRLVERHTVVPLRFGMVMREPEVRDGLLERHGPEITALLRDLDGCVQMSVKAFYGADALLRQALRANPDLKRRSQALEGRPPEQTVGERVALGQEVSRAVDEQREHDQSLLVDALTPLARDIRVEPAGGERVAAQLQLLVARDGREKLDAAVARLADAHADRFAIRYVGPLAPYSFADLSLEAWG